MTYVAHTIFIPDSADLEGEEALRHIFQLGGALLEVRGREVRVAATRAGPRPPAARSLFSPRTMAHLYGDPEWSQRDLEGPIRHAREHLAKSKLDAFSPERLESYRRELELRAEQGHPVTFVDLWALALEAMLHGQVGGPCGAGRVLGWGWRARAFPARVGETATWFKAVGTPVFQCLPNLEMPPF